MSSNMSEWEIAEAHQLHCGANSSAEIISDMNHFIFVTDGSLYLVHHKKVLSPMDFCVDQQLGIYRKYKYFLDGVKCFAQCVPSIPQ